jgi:hypothetical protein
VSRTDGGTRVPAERTHEAILPRGCAGLRSDKTAKIGNRRVTGRVHAGESDLMLGEKLLQGYP